MAGSIIASQALTVIVILGFGIVGCSGEPASPERESAFHRRIDVFDSFVVFVDQIGGYKDAEREIVIEEPALPSGVFVRVAIRVRNVTDSTLFLRDSDFQIVDEDGRSYPPSSLGTQAYSRSRMAGIRKGSDWFAPPPTPPPSTYTTTTFAIDGHNVLYQRLAVRSGADVRIFAIFDIPKTGFERSLKIRFLDDEAVSLGPQ